MTVVAKPIVRRDADEKASGRARYAVDYQPSEAAWAWPVVSTVPSGRVISINTEAASAVPGVLAVLAPDNVARLDASSEVSPAHQAAVPDLMVMQSAEIAFRGQILAAVIADSLETAREGAALVRVTEEARPDPSLVLRADHPDAVVVEMTNDLSKGHVARGDADAAFAAAPVRLDLAYETAAQMAMPMEPHATTAVWDDGRLTMYCSDQGPSWTAVTFAGLLGLDVDQVEVVSEYVGGGFGSKAAPRPPTMLAVLAARLVDRPVKVALDRPLSSALTTYRSPSLQRLRVGATTEGRITALIHETTGQTSRLVQYADQTVTQSRLLYDVPDVRTETSAVPLDAGTPGWVRAPGEAPGMFALESAVDELAVRLGLDPVALRLLNEPAVDPETGNQYSSRRLVSCLRTGAEQFDWNQRFTIGQRGHQGRRWLHGVGVAAASYPVMIFPSTATATVAPSGDVRIDIAAADIGTGARTVLHQLAADTLDMPMSHINLRMGRSSLPAAPFAGGSMGTGSWGWAVHGACEELKKAIATSGGVPFGGLEVHYDSSAAIGELAALNRHSYGAHFVELRVDRHTGEVRVDRMLGVFAAGRIINPATAKSQIVGAMTMGLGMALMEDAAADAHFGGWATQDLASYHVPAHADVADIDVQFLDEDDAQLGPVAGKGVGEIGIVGIAAAIVNAIHHATGVRIRSIPATPDKVFLGLNEKRPTSY